MVRRTVYHLTLLLVAILVPLAVYVGMRVIPGADPNLPSPIGHFVSVVPVTLLAAALSIVIGVSGHRLRNMQVTFLSLAFCSLGLVFALHGLSTPGMILPRRDIVGVAAQLSFTLAGFWLLLSSLPADGPAVLILARHQRLLVPIWSALLAVIVTVSMWQPGIVESLALSHEPVKYYVGAVTMFMLLVAAYRYWQSYRYAQLPLQYALVRSIGWIAVAQVIVTTGTTFQLSWWMYHILLLAATTDTIAGLVRQYTSGSSLEMVVRGLFTVDPMKRIEAGISPSVRALVLATEARDIHTAGHSFRVAVLALRVGEAMDLAPEQLRALAQGGIVHDVGKMEVVDAILNKPGPLTPEERAVIERHPVTGYELCRRLGFAKEELGVIRHHHERWDGTGYPDRLAGERIPLLARILSVVDVYDALTADRSYRKGWSQDEARTFILANAGTQFDPAVVEVWGRLVAEQVTADKPLWVTTGSTA